MSGSDDVDRERRLFLKWTHDGFSVEGTPGLGIDHATATVDRATWSELHPGTPGWVTDATERDPWGGTAYFTWPVVVVQLMATTFRWALQYVGPPTPRRILTPWWTVQVHGDRLQLSDRQVSLSAVRDVEVLSDALVVWFEAEDRWSLHVQDGHASGGEALAYLGEQLYRAWASSRAHKHEAQAEEAAARAALSELRERGPEG